MQTRPFAWYVFAGVDGQAVAWDETLDGLPFATSRHVSRVPFVGEFQAGITLMAWGARFTAMQVLQSNEFRGQSNGLFQFHLGLGVGEVLIRRCAGGLVEFGFR